MTSRTKTSERYRSRLRRRDRRVDSLERQLASAKGSGSESPPPGGTLSDFYEWAESSLVVPTGPLAGSPFVIHQWQRDFLEGALATGIREAGLSIARKNAKTATIAALVLGYLVGPLRTSRWRGLVISLTGTLASEFRRQVIEIAEASGIIDQLNIKLAPPPGIIRGLDGTELTLLASDKASGHAVGVDLAIIDEGGLFTPNQRDLWNAVLSSTSGRDGRLLVISIRGHSEMFSELAARADDPSVFWTEYAGDEVAKLDDVEQWHRANPGLASGIKSLDYMADASRRAIATPADSASFRTMELNLPGVPARDSIVQVADWQACLIELDNLPPRDGL